LEERVNRLSTRVDGRHACGGHHDHAFVGLGLQVAQEGGLSRSRLSREENVRISVKHQLLDKVKFLVDKGLLRHAFNRIHLAKVRNIFHFCGGVLVFVVFLQAEIVHIPIV
jgi:hypothetical protein